MVGPYRSRSHTRRSPWPESPSRHLRRAPEKGEAARVTSPHGLFTNEWIMYENSEERNDTELAEAFDLPSGGALAALRARGSARGVDATRWGEARHPVTGALVETMTPEERVTFHERKLAYHNKTAAKRAELRAAGFTVRRTQHQIAIEGANLSEARRRLATARIDVAHLARSLRVPLPRPRLPRLTAARSPRRARARRTASRPPARAPDPPPPGPARRSSGAAAPSWGAP